jgi:hypothetical protein
MSCSTDLEAQVPPVDRTERKQVERILDKIIALGDGLLADGSRLVDDLDSAITLDNVLLRFETFRWEIRSEFDLYTPGSRHTQSWQELIRSLTELNIMLTDVTAPHAAGYDPFYRSIIV